MTDQEILSSFQHQPNGEWLCIKPVQIQGTARNFAVLPGASFSQGYMFMGVDLARELDQAATRLEQ